MENKRKVKINKYFNQLKEEKDDLFDLINRHVNHVFCCVEKINNDNVNQKVLHDFLEFELKLIQMLEEFNFELESLQNKCPIKDVNPEEYESNSHTLINVVCNVNEIPTQTDAVTPTSMFNSSIGTEIPTHDTDSSLEISENFRQTLLTVSHKLGLDSQNLTSMRSFYEKPLTICVDGISDTPSVSSSRCLPNQYSSNGSAFLIPEKDVCRTINTPQEDANLQQDIVSEVQCVQFQESSSSKCTDIVSSEESDCSSSSSVILDNSNACNADFRNYNETCTAIEKLNNFKISHSKDSPFDVKPLELPNLALKPLDPMEIQSQTVIRNFESQNKTTKKKNNLDKSVIFDLKQKDVPEVNSLCLFSHIETPSDFYIHLADSESTLIDKISEAIANIALNRRTYKSKEEAYSDIHKYGVVYLDLHSHWYRMEVLNWFNEDKNRNVLVRLVDYGSTHVVPFEKLGRLTKSLADIPILAVHCHFPLMFPPDSSRANRLAQWPQDSIAQFMEISGLLNPNAHDIFFKIAYSAWNPELNAVEIDLIDIREKNEENTVGQILLNLGLAVQIIDEYDEDELEIREFLQDLDTLEEADNINEAIAGYDARDEARICRFTKPDGTCFKGKNCKLEHLPLSKDGYTTDQDVVFREAMYSLLLPKHGEYLMVLITGYKNICNFFVQLIRKPVPERSYVVDQDFLRLIQDINSPKVLNTYQTYKVAPAIGEIVLVKHWSSQWIRGVIRDFETNPDGDPFNFQVFAVDYGETLKNIKSSDLRKIKPHYLQLPFQAVECYIKDYEFNSDCGIRDAKDFFDRNMYFQNFMANILSYCLPFCIYLETMNGQINVGESLKQRRFAKRRTYDINPSEDCPLDLL